MNEAENRKSWLCIKRYFGFTERSLSLRQRCGIFLANERRTFDRLIGRNRSPGCGNGGTTDSFLVRDFCPQLRRSRLFTPLFVAKANFGKGASISVNSTPLFRSSAAFLFRPAIAFFSTRPSRQRVAGYF